MANTKIRDVLLKSTDYLKCKSIDNARYEVEVLMSHFLQIQRLNIYLDLDKELSVEKATILRNAIIERGKRKPLQYILGFVDFLGSKIEVNDKVLIPRPETEFMVDLIIKENRSEEKKIILDLCTGSGAIAISLKKKIPNSMIQATDICIDALEIAKKNAVNNNCEVIFKQSNLFEIFRPTSDNLKSKYNNSSVVQNFHYFDIIVSNPPYVSDDDFNRLPPELFFEPKKALISSANGLYYIEKIILDAKNYLKEKGLLYLEIGYNQANDVKKILNEHEISKFNIYKDLNNIDRIIKIMYD